MKAEELRKADAWLATNVEPWAFGPRPFAGGEIDDDDGGGRIERTKAGWRLHAGGREIAMPKAAAFDDTWAVWSDGAKALVACSESIVLRVDLANSEITEIATGHVRATAIAPVGHRRFLLVTPGLGRRPQPRLELRSDKSRKALHESASPTPRALVPIAGGPLVWMLGELEREKHPRVKTVPASRLAILDTTGMLATWITFWMPGHDYRLGRRDGRTLVSGHGRTFDLGDDAAVVAAFEKHHR